MSNYPLRLPDHVMSEAKHLAELYGTSLNQFLVTLIAERVGELKATAEIRARLERSNPTAALAILARAPERPPLAGDERPAASRIPGRH